jgi:hypothetical protein
LVVSGRGLSKASIDTIILEAESNLNNGGLSHGIPMEHSPELVDNANRMQDLRMGDDAM